MIGTLKQQQGLTLIELMIALTLSLLLLAGLIQVILANKQSYRMTEAHARLQENARFAIDILTTDVRSAGYTGCRAIEKMNVQNIATNLSITMNENTVITGIEAVTSSSWNIAPPTALGTVVGGTDIITVQSGSTCGGNLVGNISSSNGNVQLFRPNSCDISAGDVVMIADCEDAHIFKASGTNNPSANRQTVAHSNSANEANHFCKSYASLPDPGVCATGQAKLYNYDAEVLLFNSHTYFIRLGTGGTPALWRYDAATGAPQELIEGIDNMQITYGIDSNDDDIVDLYQNAKEIQDASRWDKVVSARISLLATTLEDNLTTDTQTLSFNGGTVKNNDGQLLRVFTTTIGIRNRLQ